VLEEEVICIPKFAELPEVNDPHMIVQLSTSDEVLRSPSVIRLYDARIEAPAGSDAHATNKKKFLNKFKFN
jgi:hypothetical protein